MKRFFRIALTALAMLAVMLFSAAITLRVALHGHEVRIPDFAGMTVAEASTAALQTGVDLNIENKFYSTTVPAGRVLSQAPAAGSTVRHGWQVRVTESLGPQQVTIPDVVGQPLREASINLRRAALDLGALAHIDAPGDPDMTLAQTPPPNAGLDQPRVNLLLSAAAGGAANAFVLPSFVGWSFPAANRAAIALGLRVALVDLSPAAAAGPNTPPGTSPATTPGAPSSPATPAKVGPATPSANPQAANVQTAAIPAAPAPPSGPVSAQSPESGYRASRGDVLRLIVGHAAIAAPTANPAPNSPSLAQP
jgi:beta-lactam-binding protein with PASTA domain